MVGMGFDCHHVLVHDVRVLLRARDDDGAPRLANDVLGDRAEDDALEARATFAPDDDEIGADLARHGKDFLRGVSRDAHVDVKVKGPLGIGGAQLLVDRGGEIIDGARAASATARDIAERALALKS